MWRELLSLALCLGIAGRALGEESAPDPAELIARGHYELGAKAYDRSAYEEALREFRAAHDAKPLPAFDYNIARCLEHLGRGAEALTAYESYLREAPQAANASEVAQRVADFKHREHEAQVATPSIHLEFSLPPPRSRRDLRWLVPGVLGGAAVVIASVGAGLLGSAAVDYGTLESSCAPICTQNLWAGVQDRERASYALFGIAGAAAIVDVALIVRAARRK